MLDHPFFGVVAQVRQSAEAAFLPMTGEDSLTSDLLMGNLTYEASFTLPGEEVPYRHMAEISLEWPTWSQTSLRGEVTGEFMDEEQQLIVVTTFRLMGLAGLPDAAALLAAVPTEGDFGGQPLLRANLSVEQSIQPSGAVVGVTAELTYEEMVDVPENGFDLSGFGPWMASILVRLADLKLEFSAEAPDE